MTQRADILLTDAEDLQFLGGDFLFGVSDQQHILHILKANKGHFYQNPLIGLGVEGLINANVQADELKQDIKIQLKSDNYRVLDFDINTDFEISINAEPLTI